VGQLPRHRLVGRSRRDWNMTPVLPELPKLPTGLVLDGELVAWRRRVPWFPNVCRRVLNADLSVPVTYVVFDLLQIDGTDLQRPPVRGAPRRARESPPAGAMVGDHGCLLTLAPPSTPPSALTASKGSSPRSSLVDIRLASAGGSSSRTRTTGGATQRSRRCGDHESGQQRR
jgi:hypothetical protein